MGKETIKPIPIPDKDIKPGMKRLTVGAPRGLEDSVRPVEVLAGVQEGELGEDIRTPITAILIKLEDGDLDSLKENPKFWLVTMTDFVPIFKLKLDGDW